MQDSKKEIISWSLYDWANSAFATTVMAAFFPIFFSEYWSLGQDASVSTFFLGIANSTASLVVAVMAPFLGAIADSGSYRKKFLIFFAFLGALMTSCLWLLKSGQWGLAILFYVVACIGFSGGNTFYDSLLPCVASDKKVDFVSALGFSLGYIGGGLLFLINVLMYLMPNMFGISSSVEAVKISFLTVGIWWLVFSIPLLLFVKEDNDGKKTKISESCKTGAKNIATTLKSLKFLKTTTLFLVAYWCYIDGVDTIIRMATDYGTSLGFSSSSLIVALLITQFVAFPAALLYNTFGKKIGTKNAILVAIVAYCIIALLGVFMTKEIHFYLLAILIGLFQGGIQALSRSYYTRLIPKDNSAQFFGFFNMLGKFAAIIGPFLVGFVTLITKSNRIGILSLILLFAVGGVLLYKVDESKAEKEIGKFEESLERA
ncbi:MAG: MFS transporter [Spirochaetales bacterium]|uniref:MFS transporter n=1 Tax=Bullifex sp. TaxID=2815808 RepID=UPI002A579373|nr:MFS transporter [Bullifex sp.]MDD5973870.1 MFS transporter [Spirochaetales bacterium]MDD7271124.1 MFS transporter [Spirochaetales bacterium]MDY4066459.1 MFS transporter [Bullifex sp.]